MTQEQRDSFARGYIAGLFDVVSAMTTRTAPHAVTTTKPLQADALAGYLSQFNSLVRAQVTPGSSIVFLFSGSDVNRIVAAALGQESTPDFSIAGRDPNELQEVFDPCIGGGVGYFKEKFGIVFTTKNLEVMPCGPDIAAGLNQYLGTNSSVAEFSFSLEDGHTGNGVFLFADAICDALPSTPLSEGDSLVAESMSQDDVGALRSNFGLDQGSEPGGNGDDAGGAPRVLSSADTRNLDMVLDIRLTATARLGRIEMPIGDIVNLGPGSIIEVGHLVDEPVDLLVNDKLIARGDVVVVDEKFGLRITEIVSARERIESLR